jgi:YidC/Oxa1 family membrane protein insertase
VKNDFRPIVAIVLCLGFYFLYTKYLNTKYPDMSKKKEVATQQQQPEAAPSAPSTAPAATTPGATTAPVVAEATIEPKPELLTAGQLTLESDKVRYQFNQLNGGFDAIVLKAYDADAKGETGAINLLDGSFAVQGTIRPNEVTVNPATFSAVRDGRSVTFTRKDGPVTISQRYEVPETGYTIKTVVTFTNTSDQPLDMIAGIIGAQPIIHKKQSNLMGFIPGVVPHRDQIAVNADGESVYEDIETLCKDGEEPVRKQSVPINYIGVDRHYFLGVLMPEGKTSSYLAGVVKSAGGECIATFMNYDKHGILPQGQALTLNYSWYFGPKDHAILANAQPALEEAMHLGMFTFIATPLLKVIEGFYSFTGNYGIAIVLLTILLKLLFYPLMKASSVSMHKMKKLNPEMTALREKFKDDKQKQQQELMKFMVQHKINPMKGCLPILPQIPVFFAFYQVLQTSIQMRHAPFFGWIQDLSSMDPWFVTPLLMGVAMFIQQKLTPTTGMDKTQEKILMFMPIMFTAMMLTLPAGLTLYMLTNTVVGIAQQKWLYKKLDKSNA